VGAFATESDDNLYWGAYCSRLLSEKITFAPNEILFIPPSNLINGFYETAQVPREQYMAASEDLENYLSNAYGIDKVLSGKITVKGDSITFKGNIRSRSGKENLVNVDVNGSLSNPSDFINRLGLDVLAKLNISLDQAHKDNLNKSNSGAPEAFKLAAQAFSKPLTEDTQAIELYGKAMSMDSTFRFAAVGACERVIDNDPLHADKFLDYVRQQHPDISSLAILEMDYLLDKNDKSEGKVYHLAEEFLKENPENCQVMGFAVYSQGRLEHPDEAEKMSEKLLAAYPESFYSHSVHQWILQRRGLAARGGNYYTDLNRGQKKDFGRYLSLALEESKICAEKHPRSPHSWSSLMDDMMETGAADSELEDVFCKATTANPHDEYPWTVMVWNYRPGYSDKPEKVGELTAEGMRLNPYNKEFALLVLKNLQWYYSQHHDAAANRYLASDTATIDRAVNCLVAYGKEHPDDEKTLMDATYYLTHSRLYVKAWPLYQLLKDPPELVKASPHDYYRTKACAASLANDTKAAVRYADLCLASNPCNHCASDSYLIKAQDIFSRGYDEQGFKYLEKAIESLPDGWFLRAQYAHYAGMANRHIDEGMGQIKLAIQNEPNNAWNYSHQARLFACKKDKINGLKAIDKAISLNSREPEFEKIKKEIQALQ